MSCGSSGMWRIPRRVRRRPTFHPRRASGVSPGDRRAAQLERKGVVMAHVQRKCSSCRRSVPPGARACPACGSRDARWVARSVEPGPSGALPFVREEGRRRGVPRDAGSEEVDGGVDRPGSRPRDADQVLRRLARQREGGGRPCGVDTREVRRGLATSHRTSARRFPVGRDHARGRSPNRADGRLPLATSGSLEAVEDASVSALRPGGDRP